MKLENKVYRFELQRDAAWLEALADCFAGQLASHDYPLRFSIVDVLDRKATVEASIVTRSKGSKYGVQLASVEILKPRKKAVQARPFGIVQIVPTGVRCEFGGFAGDACPATNLLAAAADFVVTHPNAVNASELNEMASNVLYVEGKSLDDFLLGYLGLLPGVGNKIGTVVDPTGLKYLDDIVNTLNAARAVKGIQCQLYTVLKEELGVKIEWSEAGCAVGTILNPEALLEATEVLLSRGMQAIGGVSVIHGVTKEMFSKHLRGEMPNPSGGVEAIVTHLISKIFRVPAAHAPLPYYQDVKEKSTLNPRASAEFISTPHYFSVLKGLSRAPHLVPIESIENAPSHLHTLNQVGAIVVPATCLGGVPALAAEFSGIPLIAVKENATVLRVDNSKMQMQNVVEVNSYLEAAGVVLALRNGISLESLRRPLKPAMLVDMATSAVQDRERLRVGLG